MTEGQKAAWAGVLLTALTVGLLLSGWPLLSLAVHEPPATPLAAGLLLGWQAPRQPPPGRPGGPEAGDRGAGRLGGRERGA